MAEQPKKVCDIDTKITKNCENTIDSPVKSQKSPKSSEKKYKKREKTSSEKKERKPYTKSADK